MKCWRITLKIGMHMASVALCSKLSLHACMLIIILHTAMIGY